MGFKSLIKTITFGDITAVDQRADKSIVTVDDKKYGIIKWRLDKSSCDDDVELYVSSDGKWLIPSDSVREGQKVDW